MIRVYESNGRGFSFLKEKGCYVCREIRDGGK